MFSKKNIVDFFWYYTVVLHCMRIKWVFSQFLWIPMICNSSWCSCFYTNPNTSVNIVPQGFGDRWVLCGIIWNRQVASCRYLAGAPMYSPRVSLPSSSLLCHHNICLCDIFLSKQWYTSKTQRRPYIPIVYYMSITHLIFLLCLFFRRNSYFEIKTIYFTFEQKVSSYLSSRMSLVTIEILTIRRCHKC